MDLLTAAVFLGGVIVGGSVGVLIICIFIGARLPRRRRKCGGKIQNMFHN